MIRAACSARSAAREAVPPCAAPPRSGAACWQSQATAMRRPRNPPGSGSRIRRCRAREAGRNKCEPIAVAGHVIATDCEAHKRRHRHDERCGEEDGADPSQPVIEHLDLVRVPLVVADLRRDLIFGDRLGQPRRAWSVDRAGRAAHRSPDAAGVPVDPSFRNGVGFGARRVGGGDSEQLEASHRPQPLGELPVIEPPPVPFVARSDCRIEDDRQRDHHLDRGELELQVRRHEGAQAQAHRDTAKQEVEDVPAPVGLREMGREPVGPAVRLLEKVDRSADLVGLGAAFAVAPPFVADLRFAMLVGEVFRAELSDTRRREQQRILNSRPDVAQPFVREAPEEILLLLVRAAALASPGATHRCPDDRAGARPSGRRRW